MKRLIPLFLLPLLFFIPKAEAATSFSDLYPEHPNADAFTFLNTEGAFTGFPDGTVKPDNRIERAQLAKVMAESLFTDEEIKKCTDPGFPDVPASEWFSNHVCMMKTNKIMEGYPNGEFGLTNYVNFAEAAKIVAEANKIVGNNAIGEEWYTKYVEALEEKKAIPSTVDFLDEDATRGDIAEMEYRIEAKVTDQVSKTYEEIKQTLPNISSCDALEEKMTNYLNRPVYYGRGEFLIDDVAMDEEMAPAPMAAAEGNMDMGASTKSASDYSKTNLQVEGVDEADIVKNDGKYIYMIRGNTLRIVEAYPGTSMKEVAKIDFAEGNEKMVFYPQELYVTEDRLVAIGQTQYNYSQPLMEEVEVMVGSEDSEDNDTDPAVDSKMIAPPYYNKSQSMMLVYDISDKSEPEELKKIAFDGNYSTSRRIGDQVYLILNAYPDYWNWNKSTSSNDNTFLPMLKEGDKAEQPMVNCNEVRYFPGFAVPQYLITAAVNIEDTDAPIDRDVFLGNSENVYASTTDLFVTSNVIDADSYTDWDWTKDEALSHVFRFALKDGDMDFIAQGKVPGRSLNQFSMDQHEDYFRIATTSGNVWSRDGRNASKNNIYILDGGMKEVGKLEGLAPGEQIHSTRFINDRVYMVTFEQVDPLFVIDLANPRAPKVLGELKVPGYSEYLHPFDENHLIGFGQETSVTNWGGEEEGDDFTTVNIEGFKMSLFDVTDVNNPKLKDSEVIGDSGTYSELLYNHKALLFDKEKELLAFPITIQELIKPEALQCGNYTKSTCPYNCIQACVSKNGVCADVAGSCVAPTYEQYENTFSGAVVYNVNLEDGFTEKGRISHIDEQDMDDENSWYDYNKTIQRILYIGNYLYTTAQDGIKANNLNDLKELGMVKFLPEEVNGPIMY